MEVRQSARAVLVAISQLVLPALDAIEAERGRLRKENEQAYEWLRVEFEGKIAAEARLANAEAALRQAKADAVHAPTDIVAGRVIVVVDAYFASKASAPGDDPAQVGGGPRSERIVFQSAQRSTRSTSRS
jgi:hypothetical protein